MSSKAIHGEPARMWVGMAVLLLALLSGCSTLRSLPPAPPSWSVPADPTTRLGRLVEEFKPGGEEKVPGSSLLRLLESGRAALTARLALAERAERSLDLQYYLFHGDTSGQLLARAMLRAADRGVRVRVLLDDVDTARHEVAIIGLDAHPNIEIRLFNPFKVRGDNPFGRAAEFLGRGQLNHRMHNKLFLADSLMAITGGRNIGDEYFQADSPVAFHDLDALAAGPVVAEMAQAFDRYWNSPYAVSARAIPKPDKRERLLVRVREGLEKNLAELDQDTLFDYMGVDPLLPTGGVDKEYSAWLPGRAQFLSDPPDKVEDELAPGQLPLAQLLGKGLSVEKELLIASPYFVPGQVGVDLLSYIHGKGADVKVLTNSAAATDVLVVHAGYAKYRMPLVLHGIELYELKPAKVPHRFFRRLTGGSSRTSLHSKVMVFDRQAVYIGSMNLDPRSLLLNTEAGLLVHGSELAQWSARFVEEQMGPQSSYRLRIMSESGDGHPRLTWLDDDKQHQEEPNAGFWTRFLIDLFSASRWEELL